MRDIQSTFTERFLKIQVSAEPPRPEPQARRVAQHAPAPAPVPNGSDDLFSGPARGVAPPPSIAPSVSSSLGPLGRATAAVPDVGRNDPCPCGSGKKYKKCHGAGR
jgi:preprotein translocase subunit SecA